MLGSKLTLNSQRIVSEPTLFHWLIVLAVALTLFVGRKLPEVLHRLGGGPGGPPTHPLPVTCSIETSCASADAKATPK